VIATLRKSLGRASFLAGAGLLLYQIYLWRQNGKWTSYSLVVVLESFVHSWGYVMTYIPFSSPEGIEMVFLFKASHMPVLLFRFFDTVPLSGFLMVLGYFLVRWEKYLG